MEISKKDLDKLMTMDNDSLKKAINDIAGAIGADKNKTDALTSDIGGLKSKLSYMSSDDLNKLVDSVGKENAEKIMKSLKNK